MVDTSHPEFLGYSGTHSEEAPNLDPSHWSCINSLDRSSHLGFLNSALCLEQSSMGVRKDKEVIL